LLSIFSNGIYLDTPITLKSPKILLFGLEPETIEPSIDNILLTQIQYPDISHIIAMIVGLSAILLGFDNIPGEREAGTLKLALSNNIARYQLLVGNVVANILILSLIVFLIWFASIIIVFREPFVQFQMYHLPPLIFSFFASIIHIIVFCALTLLISCVAHSSKSSLVIGITVWILLSLLTPPLGPVIAKMIVQVPSYQRHLTSKHLLLSNYVEKTCKRSKEHSPNAISKERAIGIIDKIIYPGTNQWAKANHDLNTKYQTNLKKQIKLSHLICSISPMTGLQFAISDLCNTSYAAQCYFERQAIDWAQTVFDEKPLNIHRPTFKDLSVVQRIKNSVGYLVYMLILAMFCFALAFICFIRYDVR
jgi:ABC-type transport system involved in multi-copper enzyme maturation permease subunit